MPLFLGLDCGGSTCRALLADKRGTVHFKGQGGSANVASTPPRLLEANLRKALQGCPMPQVVCGCFAGLLTEADAVRSESLLATLFSGAEIVVYPDYCAAHMASSGADFTVVAGTGSVVCSRISGLFVKSGGRGYALGDEGSGYRYGREALLHLFEEGPEDASAELKSAVERYLGTVEENEAVASLYRTGAPQAKLSRLSDAFAADWEAGADYARSFLLEESASLAKTLARHVRRYYPDSSTLTGSLAGGLWRVSTCFRAALEETIVHAIPETQVIFTPLNRAPVLGALDLALEVMNEY